MGEQFLTLKAKQQIAKHGSVLAGIAAEDEEAARRARVAQMGKAEYAAQLPKSAVIGAAEGAGTMLKGLAIASRKIADKVMDTGGLDTRDTYEYRLGQYITDKSREILRSNPDLE